MSKGRIIYTYKGYEYIFVAYGKFKHPESREWILSITYKDRLGNVYTREMKDFDDKFKRVVK